MKNDPRPGPRARLLGIADRIDAVVREIGEWTAWLSLAMVLITFAVVVLRYAFDIGSIALQESVTYMHAVLFMLGIAYTLGRNGHVRVDIFYERLSRRARARVDLMGTLLLLIPVSILIIWLGWAYVAESWRVQEASREAGGIPAVYLLKTLILIMPILLLAQGLSNALRNLLFLSGMEEALPPSDGGVGRA
ncbi:TRAP transporter small permease subunit [Thiocapsa sp.]|uniref:TRAP transporter small permease subunit n=1 Tax=Thiocapsa sp. TaxID=2024551 RepID=UPI002B7419A8|nr:TRAP transporter small permease subunit [Thiocapsa sp.]HSO81375.1 TRAP transporter small permease subunit [Thiocapsa sp.]